MEQWLFFQATGVGPMQGQLNHFLRYASLNIPYGIRRYTEEVIRLYYVLEKRLEEQEGKGKGGYLVGGRVSVADIAVWGWVNIWDGWGQREGGNFPKLREWNERLGQREGFIRGTDLNGPSKLKWTVERPRAPEGRVQTSSFGLY